MLTSCWEYTKQWASKIKFGVRVSVYSTCSLTLLWDGPWWISIWTMSTSPLHAARCRGKQPLLSDTLVEASNCNNFSTTSLRERHIRKITCLWNCVIVRFSFLNRENPINLLRYYLTSQAQYEGGNCALILIIHNSCYAKSLSHSGLILKANV